MCDIMIWRLHALWNDHPISLVTLCLHTKLWQYYWPCSLCCVLHPHGFIIQLDVLYLLIRFTCFSHLSPHNPSCLYSLLIVSGKGRMADFHLYELKFVRILFISPVHTRPYSPANLVVSWGHVSDLWPVQCGRR